MNESIDNLAARAASDEDLREELIRKEESWILRTASFFSGRFIIREDDEWSCALRAFSAAIDSYTPEKGPFLPFAKLLIRQRLIDAHRAEQKYSSELFTDPQSFERSDPETDRDGVYKAVVRAGQDRDSSAIREEILTVAEQLAPYGIRFYDLTACSPQQDKTREECARVMRSVLEEPLLLNELFHQKKLPVRAAAKASGVSKKTLDRYRKYIIMGILVLTGEYPLLAEYLSYVRKSQ